MVSSIRSHDTQQPRNRTVRNDAPTRPLFSTASYQHFGSLPLIPCRGHKVSLTPKGEWAACERTSPTERHTRWCIASDAAKNSFLHRFCVALNLIRGLLGGRLARSEPALL